MDPDAAASRTNTRAGAAIADFLRSRPIWHGHGIRLVPTQANGQPAFGYYVTDARCDIARAGGVLVLALDDAGITTITRFGDTGVLPYFGCRGRSPGRPDRRCRNRDLLSTHPQNPEREDPR